MPSQNEGQATKASGDKNQIKVRSEIEVKICGPSKKCHNKASAAGCNKCEAWGMQAQDGSAYGWGGGEELGGQDKEGEKRGRFPFKKFPF